MTISYFQPAYLQMGLKKVAEKPFDDRFIRESPDIRGVRTRWGNWSTTFTSGAFNYTRASAMLVDPDAKSYIAGLSAFHMARPYDRVSPMNEAIAVERDFGSISKDGQPFSLAKTDSVAAFATTYRLRKTSETWLKEQSASKWLNSELWISTPQGLIGLMQSSLHEAARAYEFSHQFRFIVPDMKDAVLLEPNVYQAGGLRFRVWGTSFPHAIAERTRRYFQGPQDRRDWQLSLSDSERSPEQVIQQAKTPEEKKAAALPSDKLYEPGTQQFSVVEISPLAMGGWDRVARADSGALPGLRAKKGNDEWLAIYNPADAPVEFAAPAGATLAAASWTGGKPDAGKLSIPASGVALFAVAKDTPWPEATPIGSSTKATPKR
jgi:hypothetical protein